MCQVAVDPPLKLEKNVKKSLNPRLSVFEVKPVKILLEFNPSKSIEGV